MKRSATADGPAEDGSGEPAALAMPPELCGRLTAALPALQRFARSLTKDRDEAADLTQETCLRAMACWHQWQPGSGFESWLFQIARNLWIDRLRARQIREHHSSAVSQLTAPHVDGQRQVETRLTLRSVREAVGRLPEEQREVLMRVAVGGESYKSASAGLAVPIGTIMSRLSRARRAIHAELGGPLAKSLLLALLLPLLDREARAELAEEPAPVILRKALTTLAKELGGNGSSRTEMAAALLVVLLLDQALADDADLDWFNVLHTTAVGPQDNGAGSTFGESAELSADGSAEDMGLAAQAGQDRENGRPAGHFTADALHASSNENPPDLAASALGERQTADPTAAAQAQLPSESSSRFAGIDGSGEALSEIVTLESSKANNDSPEETSETEQLVTTLFSEALRDVSTLGTETTADLAEEYQPIADQTAESAPDKSTGQEAEPVSRDLPPIDLAPDGLNGTSLIPDGLEPPPDVAPPSVVNEPAPPEPPTIALEDVIEPNEDPGPLIELNGPWASGPPTGPTTTSPESPGPELPGPESPAVAASVETVSLDEQIDNVVQSDVS